MKKISLPIICTLFLASSCTTPIEAIPNLDSVNAATVYDVLGFAGIIICPILIFSARMMERKPSGVNPPERFHQTAVNLLRI